MESKMALRALQTASFIMLLTSSMLRAEENQLSEPAMKGEQQIAICNACHDASLNPPQGPPLFGVQRRYQRQYSDKDSFVDAVVSFANHPSEEKALMRGPVKMLGLMPAMPLGDETLGQIAAYIYEATFEPPCDHWANAASGKGGGGGKGHRQQDQKMYDKFCKQ